MSWTNRWGGLGRFSPFTRSPPQGSGKVSDSDFSYITAEDLRQHQVETAQDPAASHEDRGPQRDTDVLRARNKRSEYAIHFPAYSIANGELTIGQVRDQVAKKVGTGDSRRVKLLYRGKNLKDDARTCKQEGLRHDVELMCTVADTIPGDDSDDDDEDDEFADGPIDDPSASGEQKRRRNRGKKTKRRNKREDREAVSGSASPQVGENLSVPPNHQPARTQSPRPPATPATPLDKLNALHQTLQTFIPAANAFLSSPPTDPAKKEFEYKKLSETILAQVLLKMDAVETDGDPELRATRKEYVKQAQQVLTDLDAAAKS